MKKDDLRVDVEGFGISAEELCSAVQSVEGVQDVAVYRENPE